MQTLFLTKSHISSSGNMLAHTGDDTGTLLGIFIAIVIIALVILIVAIIMKRRKG